MKRASDATNYSLVLTDTPLAAMKVRCSAADSLLRTISLSVDSTISLWALEEKGCGLIYSNEVQNPQSAKLRIDAMSLGATDSRPLVACGNNDLSIQIYGMDDLSSDPKWRRPHAHDSYINDCKFLYSNSGDLGLVTCSDDQTIRVWNINAGPSETELEFRTRSTPVSIATHREMPDHFWVAEIDGTVKLYDRNSSVPVCTLSSSSKFPFHQMDWNNQSVNLIGGVDRGKWFVWDWKMGQIASSAGTLCEATGFHWSYSHKNLFSIHSSSEVLIWDTNHLGVGCDQLQRRTRIHDSTWLSDNPCSITATGGNLIFWNINT